jgi:hypothetical protein
LVLIVFGVLYDFLLVLDVSDGLMNFKTTFASRLRPFKFFFQIGFPTKIIYASLLCPFVDKMYAVAQLIEPLRFK